MKALIVDDERLARNELQRLLAVHPEVEVVGEAANGMEAVALIERFAPDLVFLDVQMPGASGFEVLASLDRAPRVIFTTAYDHFAIRAFEVNALDYLLKPVEPQRLAQALERFSEEQGENHGSTPTEPTQALNERDRVFVKDGERCWFVALSEVVLFESEGNYTRLFFGNQQPLVYRSLANLEARLDPKVFFRISRKHIVNLKAVTGLESGAQGGMEVRLSSGKTVTMSRRQARKFKEMLQL